MVRKCGRGILGEIAVMEVGVRTRSQANSAMAVNSSMKKRKVNELAKLSSRKSTVKTQRANIEKKRNNNSEAEKKPCSDEDLVILQVSRCSCTYGTSEIADDNHRFEEAREGDGFVDLEDNESNEAETSTYNSCRRRREMTPSSKLREESNGLESISKPTVVNSDRRSPATLTEKMPSESEIEEFFAAAEKHIQTRFAKKYNYDIEKDTPLEGRYEWVRLKP